MRLIVRKYDSQDPPLRGRLNVSHGRQVIQRSLWLKLR